MIVDPLLCPKCKGTMKIIAFIEDPAVTRKILVYLDLFLSPARYYRGIEASGVSEEVKEQILGKNAAILFKLYHWSIMNSTATG